MKPERYLFPATAEQAMEMLAEYNGAAMLISGGTDLMLWMKDGKKSPRALIDVDRIPELHTFGREGNRMMIGAGVTHAQVAADPEIRGLFPCLSKGCGSVGAPQTRNIGSVGGNIVSAQPAADSSVNFVALDAACEILSPQGRRIVPVESLFLGVGQSALDPCREIMTKIIIPIPQGKYATSYQRIAQRNALSLPVINVAARLEADGGRITDARIVIAPVAVTPFRARATEQLLLGKSCDDAGMAAEAGASAMGEVHPRDSLLRGSGEYRKHLVKSLVESAVREAAAGLLQ